MKRVMRVHYLRLCKRDYARASAARGKERPPANPQLTRSLHLLARSILVDAAAHAAGYSSVVNIYATTFARNSAARGMGSDIYGFGGTVTIHDACPSPYSASDPNRGSALDTYSSPLGKGNISGSIFSFSSCGHFVADMTELWDKVSNAFETNQGENIMGNGHATTLKVGGEYKCSEGTCANDKSMLHTHDLYGTIQCFNDDASCVLNGESSRRGLYVSGTGSTGATLTIRAIRFYKGHADGGGGVYVDDAAKVDITLCVFDSCEATDSSNGGGGIFAIDSGTVVNIYATTFTGNSAASGNGGDFYRNGGSGTIHNTVCPSPYSDTTPTQGLALDIYIDSSRDETKLSYKHGSCIPSEWKVSDMTALFNKVSNYELRDPESKQVVNNIGADIMENGDTTTLSVGDYKCSDGTCNGIDYLAMLGTSDLYGEIRCEEDNASCILNGESKYGGIGISGTGSETSGTGSGTTSVLRIRAIKFYNTLATFGGGISVESGKVEITLCVFDQCKTLSRYGGGGAIFVASGSVTISAAEFTANEALNSGQGDDIYNKVGEVSILDTCPSPLSANTPTQIRALDVEGQIDGSKFSFKFCIPYFRCDAGLYNPSGGVAISDCEECVKGKYSAKSSLSCTSCVAGKFSAARKSTACADCEVGKYNENEAQESCTNCGPGRYSATTAATLESVCHNCEHGKSSSDEVRENGCDVCVPGKSASAPGLAYCDNCAAGTYSNNPAGPTTCEKCESGKYSSAAGSTSCMDCESGTYNTVKGSVACEKCPGGKRLNDDGDGCDKCPDGMYSNPGATSCSTCEHTDGWVSEAGESGAESCSYCGPGSYADISSHSCKPCEVGKYSVGGKNYCEICASGTDGKTGATSCSPCPPGTVPSASGDTCKKCKKGKFALFDAKSCEDCDDGFYSNEASGFCLPCPAGTFSSENRTTCISCPAGTWSGVATYRECSKCQNGKYSEEQNSKECKSCPDYQTSNEGATSCVCAQSFVPKFVSKVNSTTSKELTCECEPGKELKNDICTPCPSGFFRDESFEVKELCRPCNDVRAVKGSIRTDKPANSSKSCICGLGEFRKLNKNSTNGECLPCPEGALCEEVGVNVEDLLLLPGYWRSSSESFNVVKCYNKDSCIPQDLNQTDDRKWSADAQCAEGSTGPLCNVCREGYGKNVLGTCDPCSGEGAEMKGDSIFFLSAIFVAFCVAIHYIIITKKKEEKKREKRKKIQQFSRGSMVSSLRETSDRSKDSATKVDPSTRAAQGDRDHWFNRGRTKAKIMVSFFQIMTSFEGILEVRFPPIFEKFSRWISSTVNLDALQLGRADCIMKTNFYSTLLVQTITPLALSVIIFVTFQVCKNIWGKTKKKRAQFRDFASSAFLTVAYVVFASVSTTIFDCFNCSKFGDDKTSYLARDQSINCESEQHAFYENYAKIMIVVYPIGVPLMYFCILWNQRKELQERDRDFNLYLQKTSFLWENYEPHLWW